MLGTVRWPRLLAKMAEGGKGQAISASVPLVERIEMNMTIRRQTARR